MHFLLCSFIFFHFLSFSFIFFHFLSFSFIFLSFSFVFFRFLSFSFIFFHFLSLSFIFFYYLSLSFIIFHYLSFSFIFFHFLSFSLFFFSFSFSLSGAQNLDEKDEPLKLVVFTRLEFQDGTHKEGQFRYVGSGRPHVHVLIFSDELDRVKLEEFVSAAAPLDEVLRGKVACSQRDREEESKWPIYDGRDGVGWHGDSLKLKHTVEDEEAGVHRAYFTDIMDGYTCHQDLQVSDGEALLLQYVTKYCSKFSDSNHQEWLNDDADANAVARRVCYEYHPYEPEMLLQLSGQMFKQWHINTKSRGKRTITAPWPAMPEQPTFVQQYMESTWRNEDMSLLEYLRKTTNDGGIIGWIRTDHRNRIEVGGRLYQRGHRHAR